jgi:predicted nucleic acid-binding Zn ribbon protein
MAERRTPPAECANCGAAIPRSARACPECGADERTGWREASVYDGLDLPDEAFAEESDGDGARNRPATRRINGVAWYWWLAAVLLVLALILGGLSLR